MTRPPNTNGASTAAKRTLEEGKKIGERGAATAEAVARSGLSSTSELANRSVGEARKGTMGTAADAGGALMNGAQEISQAWMDLAQDRMQRMADGMRALATCRTPADLMKAQSELLQGAVEQMIDTNRRVADVSMRVMQEVTAKVTAPIKGDLT
jgi:phasin family protein